MISIVKKNIGVIFLTCSFFLGLHSFLYASPSGDTDGREKKRATVSSPFGFIFSISSKAYLEGKFVNFELMKGKSQSITIEDYSVKNKFDEEKIERMLNEISRKSDYDWSKKDGVFNVFPKDTIGRDDYVLNAKLNKIEMDGTGIKSVIDALSNELEEEYGNKYQVQIKGKWQSVLIPGTNVEARNGKPGVVIPDNTPISLKLKDVTVREVLNQAAIQENEPYYITRVKESGTDCLFLILKRTPK
ncbi:MAG TPA: hypothetical protein VK791_02195 [bacterium]|jgi:hypothetical protein|nr:hypothetical protein [bacterium]